MNNVKVSALGQPKNRKKLLTDPERIRAKCEVCKEVGNVENLI